MAITVIVPTRGDLANYDQTIELDGVVFGLRFRFNQRDDSWYVSLHDADGRAIRSGIKLIPNYGLLHTLRDAAGPIGDFVVVDVRAVPSPPTLAELGGTSVFTYTGVDP